MKKLIIDACTKTAFCFNNQIYKQINGASELKRPYLRMKFG